MHGMNEIYLLLCMHKECITGTQLEENEKTTRTTYIWRKKRSYLLYLDFSWVSRCTCVKVANGEMYISKGMCNRTSINSKCYRFLWIAKICIFYRLNNIRALYEYRRRRDFDLTWNSLKYLCAVHNSVVVTIHAFEINYNVVVESFRI